MIRISRISNPRATLTAIALLTVVMLTIGAFSAEETVAGAVLAGESVSTAGPCQRAPEHPCPHTAIPGAADAIAQAIAQ